MNQYLFRLKIRYFYNIKMESNPFEKLFENDNFRYTDANINKFEDNIEIKNKLDSKNENL